jgi:hypothetical protein
LCVIKVVRLRYVFLVFTLFFYFFMKSSLTLVIFACLFFLFSCEDNAIDEALSDNFISAQLNGQVWKAESVSTQKSAGENGPLLLIGEGAGYEMKLEMRGITATGEYPMGLSRVGRVIVGNIEYSSLDVDQPGTILITRFDEHLIEGEFAFTAQWLSANNTMQVDNGKFKAFVR